MSDNERVRMNVLMKVAPLRSDSVNVLEAVNIFENVFDLVNVFDSVGVNVSVAIGRHPSIVVPMKTFNVPNVSFLYVAIVITDAAGTPEKAFDETIGDVSP